MCLYLKGTCIVNGTKLKDRHLELIKMSSFYVNNNHSFLFVDLLSIQPEVDYDDYLQLRKITK